jgi:hypothetical protein
MLKSLFLSTVSNAEQKIETHKLLQTLTRLRKSSPKKKRAGRKKKKEKKDGTTKREKTIEIQKGH